MKSNLKKSKVWMYRLLLIFLLLLATNLSFADYLMGSLITTEAASTPVLSKKAASLPVYGNTSVLLKNTSSKKKVTWTSSDKSVVTVKSSGTNGYKASLVGKKAGKTTITAKYNGKTYVVIVTVKAPALSKKTSSVTAGKKTTIQISHTVSSKKVTWKSSNSNVASVTSSGTKATVTGKKVGTATITATYAGKKYSCTITVKSPPKKVKIAVARDTTGNTGSIVSMLNRLDNVECKIVSGSCNVKNYDGLILPGGGWISIQPSMGKRIPQV